MDAAFFDAVRTYPFGGVLTQKQVEGIKIILDAWEKYGDGDITATASPTMLKWTLPCSSAETVISSPPKVSSMRKRFIAPSTRQTLPHYTPATAT